MKRLICVLQLIPVALQVNEDKDVNFWNRIGKENVERKLKRYPYILREKKPKNVILFIGDGLGISTLTSARIHNNQASNHGYLTKSMFFENFDAVGLVKTSSIDHHVTDSAAGAVSFYTGWKAESHRLGLKPGTKTFCTNDNTMWITDGIAEGALDKGMEVGFVTNTRVTHATPAALYAKGVHRKYEFDDAGKEFANCTIVDIALQLLSYPANKFKVLMGGGKSNLRSTSNGGKRKDGRDIDIEWSNLGGKRRVMLSVEDLHEVVSEDEKLLGLFADSHVREPSNHSLPRLYEMTVKAIKQLQSGENGFFLMVEGGLIDVEQHVNRLYPAFRDVREFDLSIQKAREMTDPSETLIIVTADHGHALTLPGWLPVEASLFENDFVKSAKSKEEVYFVPAMLFATGPGYRGSFKVKEVLIHEKELRSWNYQQPTAIPHDYGSHGGEDVGIWADGPYSQLFSASLENTEIAYLIKFLLCMKDIDNTICDRALKGSAAPSFLQETTVIYLAPIICAAILLLLCVPLLSFLRKHYGIQLDTMSLKHSNKF
ncbi:unnamed protein product [Cylicocyclus nassatus]|uniref:alkaline phosphatase n=1 Tax=Cylicocyclus nassatus TaxID=53992 RepID=A0AA36H3V4_CYLNA|nr:unnamed protein product [Cylicocyclus nassatus]